MDSGYFITEQQNAERHQRREDKERAELENVRELEIDFEKKMKKWVED